jgi:hypothetical protein
MGIVTRIAGTSCVTILLTYPMWAPQWGDGLLGEIAGQPLWASAAIIAGFLGLVALYCRALQRTLTLIRPAARRARPGSVWWMFAVPHNFVEDFFIVRAVAGSLATAGTPAREVRRWELLGYGWCTLQIVSLLPGVPGLAGGAGALPLWAAHWALTTRLNRRLARPAAAPDAAGPDVAGPDVAGPDVAGPDVAGPHRCLNAVETAVGTSHPTSGPLEAGHRTSGSEEAGRRVSGSGEVGSPTSGTVEPGRPAAGPVGS